jgi:single-strand DNA-binding protein
MQTPFLNSNATLPCFRAKTKEFYMNKIIVTGALGRDAELKTLPSGKNVLEFSIAVNSGFGDSKKTYWWKAKLFGDRAAKLVEHFVKGTKLLIEGVPELREYEAKDGNGKRISPEIFVTDFEFIGGRQATQTTEGDLDQDIPF